MIVTDVETACPLLVGLAASASPDSVCVSHLINWLGVQQEKKDQGKLYNDGNAFLMKLSEISNTKK